MEGVAVADADELDPFAVLRLEHRGVGRGQVVDEHVVEDHRELLLGKHVSHPADDERTVEPCGHAGRPVLSPRVVVVVPVARAPGHPDAAVPGHGHGRPDVGACLAGFVERVVERAPVTVHVVVDAVRVDGQALVGRVHERDLERLALPHLQDRTGDGRGARCEPVADQAVRDAFGVHRDPPHGRARRGCGCRCGRSPAAARAEHVCGDRRRCEDACSEEQGTPGQGVRGQELGRRVAHGCPSGRGRRARAARQRAAARHATSLGRRTPGQWPRSGLSVPHARQAALAGRQRQGCTPIDRWEPVSRGEVGGHGWPSRCTRRCVRADRRSGSPTCPEQEIRVPR